MPSESISLSQTGLLQDMLLDHLLDLRLALEVLLVSSCSAWAFSSKSTSPLLAVGLVLASFAFRLTLSFLLLLGSLDWKSGHQLLVLSAWHRASLGLALALLDREDCCRRGRAQAWRLCDSEPHRRTLPIGTRMCMLTIISILASIWLKEESADWFVCVSAAPFRLGLGC